jgi:hypothetical protein
MKGQVLNLGHNENSLRIWFAPAYLNGGSRPPLTYTETVHSDGSCAAVTPEGYGDLHYPDVESMIFDRVTYADSYTWEYL